MSTKEQIGNTGLASVAGGGLMYYFDLYSAGIIALVTLISGIAAIVFYYLRHRELKRHNTEMEKIKRKYPELDI